MQAVFEKIIEKLEVEADSANDKIMEQETEKDMAYYDGYDDGCSKAIEIVKHGGLSDDVCEWKSVSNGEFIQNPHTKRLYSNEPSMRNVYCNTCGKKIKIVGD